MLDTLKFVLDSNVVHNIISNHNDSLIKIFILQNNPPSGSAFNWTIIIPIIVIIIGSLITFYQVMRNTISGARIKWIENFSNYVSEYCVYAEKTVIQIENMNDKCALNPDYRRAKTESEGKSDGSVFYEEYLKDYQEYLNCISKTIEYLNKIKVFLKINDSLHREIDTLLEANRKKTSKLYKIYNTSNNSEISNRYIKKIKKNTKKIVILSRDIIANEWKKSKSYIHKSYKST